MDMRVPPGARVVILHHSGRIGWAPFAVGVTDGVGRPSSERGRYFYSVIIDEPVDPLCFLSAGQTWHCPSVRRWDVKRAAHTPVNSPVYDMGEVV